MYKLQQKRLNDLLEGVGDMALKRRARKIIEELDLQDGDKVLDLGCGDGFYLHLLSNLGLGLKLTGSDFDSVALSVAKKRFQAKGVVFVKGDLMNKLPFKDNSFDKIVMSEVAEHLPDDLKGFKEIYRVLKPGGVLCVSVPNANYPFLWDPLNWLLERIFDTHIKTGFWAGFWFNHVRLYTPERLMSVAQKSNFKVEELRSLTWWCLPFNHYLVNIVARLLWGGKLSPKLASYVNKYEIKSAKPLLINVMFKVVNLIDRLNDVYQPVDRGVGIVAKFRKL